MENKRVELSNGNIVRITSVLEDETTGLFDVALKYEFSGLVEHLTYTTELYCLDAIDKNIKKVLDI